VRNPFQINDDELELAHMSRPSAISNNDNNDSNEDIGFRNKKIGHNSTGNQLKMD
jgi:hypothetical protein